ncbi:ABC-three component system middle component 8 [Devosia sp. 66-14]|uniref:ABC-three component system middle component 8 n=1 Tax=unclassified Devosia TaxID=196773 RepID=UPI00086D6D34|nr:MAG: hypothetical protein ABS47_20940 [Devosia sp. SCN 66-27]OJX23787.1 MAG: hypothetical protein BGO83_02715 [Devosia sp. 66-14]
MITPQKHMNLDVSVLRVSSLALREVRRRRVMEFQSLRSKIVRLVGSDADLVFLPALSLLYLLGRLEYHPKNDSLEYREH